MSGRTILPVCGAAIHFATQRAMQSLESLGDIRVIESDQVDVVVTSAQRTATGIESTSKTLERGKIAFQIPIGDGKNFTQITENITKTLSAVCQEICKPFVAGQAQGTEFVIVWSGTAETDRLLSSVLYTIQFSRGWTGLVDASIEVAAPAVAL